MKALSLIEIVHFCPVSKTSFLVRGYHCDAYGHVNNARYLEFLEEGRWAFLQPAIDEGFFEKMKLLFVVVNININYRKSIVPNMKLEVSVASVTYFNSKILFKQEILDAKTGVLCSDAEVTFVLLDKDSGRPIAISSEIKTKFDELLKVQSNV
ncbi:MAG: hypothetical protein RLZZ337_324 [Bacteroidota bacterium]|jgi:thioesterase-3